MQKSVHIKIVALLILIIVLLLTKINSTLDNHKTNLFNNIDEHNSTTIVSKNAYKLSDNVKLKIKQKEPKITITKHFPKQPYKDSQKAIPFIHSVNNTMTRNGYVISSSNITDTKEHSTDTIVTLTFEKK